MSSLSANLTVQLKKNVLGALFEKWDQSDQLSEMKILASPNTKEDHSCETRMLECLLLHCVQLFLHTRDCEVKCSLRL